jgi:DNA-binding helix-hairpin-helix protein with protein kinase domain
MTWPDGSDLAERSLSIGAKLGTGGQGAVHDLGKKGAGYVYKEYLDVSAVNAAALADLVALPGSLPSGERDRLLSLTAWPLARVMDGNQIKGFIMKKVPLPFWGEQGGGLKPLEAQFLMYSPKPMWGKISPPGIEGRLEIARQSASLFQLLHAKGLVIGDVSMRNMLWSQSPAGIFLLDCDGVRIQGRRPVMAQPETPDWNDPLQSVNGPDQDTDRYKLALLIMRVLTQSHDLRPGSPFQLLPGLPERVVAEVAKRFAEAAGPRGTRPDAGHWIMALSDRGTIGLPPLSPVSRSPNIDRAPLDEPGQRPVIRLKP